jgi:hypothetical protein
MSKITGDKPKFIIAAELARRFGVTEKAVRKAVAAGRIVPQYVDAKGRRWFVEATARAMWAKNTLPEKPTGRTAVVATEGDGQAGRYGGIGALEARTRRETARTRLFEIQAKRMEQEVVFVEEVARMWEKHVSDAKRLFLPLSDEFKKCIPSLTGDDVALIENRIVAILETLDAWKPGEMFGNDCAV